jgi:hypothetical protein
LDPEAGFLLPLTVVASMGLVLSSLSLQATALQSRLYFRSQVQVRSDQDQLSQAAQRLVSQINLLHPCLLHLPEQEWALHGTACIDVNRASRLIDGGDGSPADVRTLDWQPDASGQKVMLLLQLPKAEGGSGRRGLFAIQLGGDPVRAWSIQEQGLLGAPS